MSNPWTLKWGCWRQGYPFSKDTGQDSAHSTLGECQKEVDRLKKHYEQLGITLWFANAQHVNGQSELNLHR
ncbi:MAG: hypothetical protein HRT95_03680 [Moritella sp.]|uniref:hypothetical protein n=1 Tax=Moritella sp. TaxID=78556 RepID=UPI001D91F52B|nr:hypothetical protein [Moritella sp.]NQZ49305.1 hypothetical protein [Moritella sp.]